MNENEFKKNLIDLSEKISLGILKFQEETYLLSNSNENKTLLNEYLENVQFIVGVLTVEVLAITNILDIINKDNEYFNKNFDELIKFSQKLDSYCKKYELN